MRGMHRWLKLCGIALALGLVVGGGYGLYRWQSRGVEAELRRGENAYAQGERAFASQDYLAAVTRFDEAVLIAQNAIAGLEEQATKLQDKSLAEADEARELQGRTFWLKARSLRGLALARLARDGKPLPAPRNAGGANMPGSLLEHISYRRILDRPVREEAIKCLRLAATRLPDVADVQREALAMELDLEPPYWPAAQAFASNLLRQAGNDVRALHLLARFEYEQPAPGTSKDSNWVASPLVKRSRERMLKSRQYLARLKEIEQPPRWSSLALEAQIHHWMIQYYRTATVSRPAEELQEDEALRALLFDEPHGALHRALQETGPSKLSAQDLNGLRTLHLLALEKALDNSRRLVKERETAASERVLRVFDATIALCQKFAGGEVLSAAQFGEIVDTAVLTALRAQPFLAKERAQPWAAQLEAVQALARLAAEKQVASPLLYLNLAELLQRESRVQGNLGQSARQQELRDQALQWIDQGLRAAEARKSSPVQVVQLHEMAARLKAVATGRREDVAEHVKVLRESRSSAAQATAYLLEGMFAQREGRLERARENLERVLRLTHGEQADKAHLVLANIYLALGEPDEALGSLREVERLYAQYDRLTDEERAWVREFIRSPAEAAYLQIQAHLASARSKWQHIAREKPEGQALDGLRKAIAQHEEQVSKLMARLPQLEKEAAGPKVDYHHNARHLLVTYYGTTGRRERAEQELASLKSEQPDSLNVLKQEVALMTQPGQPARLAQADQRIQDFIAGYPNDVNVRLFWTQWLASTGRAAQAAAYLENPSSFPGASADPGLKQALAVLHYNLGETDKVRQLAGELPSGPVAERLAVLIAGSDAERQDKLAAGLNHYENDAFFRVYSAGVAFSKRDYVQAARSYLQALEFSRVRDTARRGLGNALLALAQDDPHKARELAGQMLGECPTERSLLLAFAYACLLLDDLGDPAVRGAAIKDMNTALNALEQAAGREADSPATGPLVKAQFWTLAGRPDRARSEVLRALERSPKNEGALLLAAKLALESQDATALVTGQKHLGTLLQVNPNSLEGLLLQARYREADRLPEALETYKEIVAKHPNAAAGYAGLVDLLTRQGEPARALTWAQQWRSRVPGDLAGLTAEVRVLALSGRVQEAIQAGEKAIDDQVRAAEKQLNESRAGRPAEGSDPDASQKPALENLRLAVELAVATGLVKARAFDEAEQWTHRILKARPDQPEAHLLLGDIHLARVQRESWPFLRVLWARKAHDAYGKVYALQRGHLLAGNNLAWLLATELGDPERALTIAREVRTGRFSKKPISGDRLPAEVLDTFGEISKSLDKPEVATEMRDLFRAAVQRYAFDPRMYLHLGRAYAGLRDSARARDMFATAVALSKSRSTLAPAVRQRVMQEAELEQKKLSPSGDVRRPPADF